MATSAAADATWLPGPLLGSHAFDQPAIIALTLVALVLVPVLASCYFGGRNSSDIPLANPPKPFQLKGQVKMQFARECVRILNDAKKRFPNRPFSFLGPMGHVTMLPADRALEVKESPALNFRKVFSEASGEGSLTGIPFFFSFFFFLLRSFDYTAPTLETPWRLRTRLN